MPPLKLNLAFASLTFACCFLLPFVLEYESSAEHSQPNSEFDRSSIYFPGASLRQYKGLHTARERLELSRRAHVWLQPMDCCASPPTDIRESSPCGALSQSSLSTLLEFLVEEDRMQHPVGYEVGVVAVQSLKFGVLQEEGNAVHPDVTSIVRAGSERGCDEFLAISSDELVCHAAGQRRGGANWKRSYCFRGRLASGLVDTLHCSRNTTGVVVIDIDSMLVDNVNDLAALLNAAAMDVDSGSIRNLLVLAHRSPFEMNLSSWNAWIGRGGLSTPPGFSPKLRIDAVVGDCVQFLSGTSPGSCAALIRRKDATPLGKLFSNPLINSKVFALHVPSRSAVVTSHHHIDEGVVANGGVLGVVLICIAIGVGAALIVGISKNCRNRRNSVVK